MLFVIYEFTRRGRSILVEAVYSIWQQIMLIYAVEVDFSIALWTVWGCSVLAESDIAVKRASYHDVHLRLIVRLSNSRHANKIHIWQTSRNKCQSCNTTFYGGRGGFFLHGTLIPKPTDPNWFGDLWKILSLDWSHQSQRCCQIQILTSTKRPADPVGWVKRMYSIHISCQ